MNIKARHASALFAGLVVVFRTILRPKNSRTPHGDDFGGRDRLDAVLLAQTNHKEQRKQARAGLVHKAPGPRGRFAFSPLVVDRVMYVVGGGGAIVALDATNGKQIWSHPLEGTPTYRDFNYWESKDRSDRRLHFWPVDSYLQK